MTSIHSQTRASGTGAQKRRLSIPSHKLSLDSVAGPTWRSLQTKTHNALVTLKSEYTEPGVVGKELALFAGYLVAGANDAAPGAVLPSIQEHYNIGYIVVSMIFICNLAGWLIAAGLCPWFTDKFGFGKAVSFFAVLAVIPYAIFIALLPFGVFAFFFVFSGVSIGSQDSLANAWMSNRPRADLRLGILHFIYGVGALAAPLCAAPFNEASYSFSYFYAIPLGLAVLNTSLVTGAWRWKREVEHASDHGITQTDASVNTEAHELATMPQVARSIEPASGPSTPAYELKTPPAARLPPNDSAEDIRAGGGSLSRPDTPPAVLERSADTSDTATNFKALDTKAKYKLVFRNPRVYIIAFFTLFYVGCEVAIGGWSSSFLLAKESHDISIADANHLISGFWAGIAAGRVILIPLTSFIGAQLAVFAYLLLAIGLQVVVWLAPHVIADGIALALMGVFLGPIFPILIEISSHKIRPRALHTTAIAFIVSFGSAGSALFPFIVGLISQAKGIKVLPPILIALLAAQVIIWAFLGDPRKRAALVQDRVD